MSRPKVSITESLPPRRMGRRPARDWSPVLDVALEHEGSWVALEDLVRDSYGKAHTIAGNVRRAGEAHAKRLGLSAGFVVAIRQRTPGEFVVFVRKLPKNGAAS